MSGEERGGSGAAVADGPPQPTAPSSPNKRPALPSVAGKIGVKPWSRGGKHNKIGSGSAAKEVGGDGGSGREGSNDDDNVRVGGPQENDENKENGNNSGGGKSKNFNALLSKFGGSVKRGGKLAPPAPEQESMPKLVEQQERQHQQEEEVDEEDPPPPPPPLPPGEGEVKKEEEKEQHTGKGIGGKGNFKTLPLKFGGGGKNPLSPQQQQQHRQKEEEEEKEEEDKEENPNGKGRVDRGNFNALSSKFVGGGKKQKESSKEEESKEDEEDEKRNKKSSGGGKSNSFHALSLKGNFKAPSPKFGLSRKKPQQQWQEGQHQQEEKVDEEDPPPPPPPPPPLPPGEGEVKEEEEEKYTNKGIGGKGNFKALSLKFGGGGKNPLSPLPQQQHRQEEKEKEEADENENHSGKGRVSRSNFNALSSKFGAGGKKQKDPKEEESKEEESKEEESKEDEEGEELNKKSSGGGKSNNFLALSSKFGGGGKVGLKKLRQLQPQQQRRDESNLTGALASKFGGDLGKNNRPQQQSPMQREEEKGGAEEGEGFTMLPIGSGGDEQSSGSLFSRAVAAPQSAMLSPGDKPLPSPANRIESSQPDSNHQTTGSLDHGSEGPQSVAEVNDETLKGDSGTLSPPLEGKGSKKLPHIDMSFLKSKFQPPQQPPWWQLQTQRQPEPREMLMPAPPSIAGSAGDNENAGNAKWNLAVEGLDKVTKKLPFAKPPQQGKPPTTQRSRAPPPQVKSRQRSSSTPIKPNKSRYPPQGASHLDNPHPNAAKVKTSPQRGRNNMFKPKSRQRLALEQVAARYFLNQGDDDGARRRYVGITTYGYDGDCNPPGAGVLLGNINEDSSGATPCSGVSPPLGLNERRPQDNEDRRQLISFLGASDNDDVRNAVKKKSVAEQSQEIQSETDIDAILEIASDHLSLGKNDLALQAYRRAMKCAFANVLSVKQKLVEVTQKRLAGAATDGEVEEEELTKQQEKVFELSLLQVASRVADIHNNIGVVHEMNRHYHKARDSYVDALEVYHNTCRRFEEKGDPDVDRTKKNVERMAMACASEEDRRKLHDEAAGLARRLDKERGLSSAQRKSLLGEAVSTLQKALELENSTIGASHPVAAATLVKIGKHRYEMRQYTAAARDIRRAVEILRNALGGCHPQVGKMTLLLASVYERHGGSIVSPATASEPEGGGGNGQGPGTSHSSEDAELELYVDALEPLKATLGEVHPEVGFLYVKIGYLYGKKGDLNLSLLAYKAALNAYSEPPPAAPSSTGGERSMMHPEVLSILSIWVQVTQHLTNLKSWHDVVVAGRRALFLLRRSKNILFPGARLIMAANNSSATSISGAGSASSPNHPPVTPPKSSKISHIQITPDTYYDSLYATLQCLAQAHTSLSDYPQARDACAESLRLAWEMALSEGAKTAASSSEKGEDQAPPLTRSILRIVRALKRLGKAHLLEQRYATALDCFLPSLELLRSSPDMESTLDCASILGSLGFLSLKLKKYTESSNFLRECLRLYEKNGVDTNDRESRKVQAWLKMAESIEDEAVLTPPSFLEIPTIHFHDENSDVR